MQAECQKVEKENRKIFSAWQIENHTKKYGKRLEKQRYAEEKAGTAVIKRKSRQETGGTFLRWRICLWQEIESSKCMKLRSSWKKV